MIGAILGDIIGSVYEFSENKDDSVPLFPPGASVTDDSVLCVATAEALMGDRNYARAYRAFGRRHPYPKGGYGLRFKQWLDAEGAGPYGSWGNGAAMRVAPVGWLFETEAETVEEARRTAAVTHNHPEGLMAAEAVALAVFLARRGASKDQIKQAVSGHSGYNLNRSVLEIRWRYGFTEKASETAPEAIIAFLESTDFESAVRNAISLGGDADTLGCITGGIAEAFYRRIPGRFATRMEELLPLDMARVVAAFREQYCRGVVIEA